MFPRASNCVGVVTKDEQPVPPVIRPDAGRADAIPLRIVPAKGHFPEYGIESSDGERGDVLQEDVLRSKCANNPDGLEEQRASFTFDDSRFLPRSGDVLAGEASADEVNWFGVLGDAEGLDISIAGDFRPMLAEDGAGVRLDFAEPSGFKASCPLEPEFDSSDQMPEKRLPTVSFFTGIFTSPPS